MKVVFYFFLSLCTLQLHGQVTAPWFEDFETFIAPDTFTNGWSRTTTDSTWTVTSGSTPSGGTGPLFDNTFNDINTGNYLYTEANTLGTGENYLLISPEVNVQSLNCAYLSFFYHLFGSSMGNLHIDLSINNSRNWIEDVFILEGRQQNLQDDPWEQAFVNLSPYMDGAFSIKIRFRGERGFSFSSDIAIDDVSVFDGTDLFSVFVDSLHTPISSSCALDETNQITIRINNTSCQDISAKQAILRTTINGPSSYLLEDTIRTAIGTSSSIDFQLDSIVDLSLNGEYTCLFEVELLNGLTNISTLPFETTIANNTVKGDIEEDFESFTFGSIENPSGWYTPEGFGTFVTANSTPNENTGPAFDNTPSGFLFIYADAFETSSDSIAAIVSPCIDVSDLQSPLLNYHYHLFGREMGNLIVDISNDDGQSFSPIDSITAEQQDSEFEAWRLKQLNLNPFITSEHIRIRFRAAFSGSILSDIAIDDFSIIDTCIKDIALDEIYIPPSNCGLSSQSTLSVEVNNLGCTAYTNIPITLVVNQDTIRETIISLAPFEASTYSFANRVDLSADTSFVVSIFHKTDDTITTNNHIDTRFFNFSVPPIPVVTKLNDTICLNESTTLVASGENLQWRDQFTNRVLFEGDTFVTGALTKDTSFIVQSNNYAPGLLSTGFSQSAFTCNNREVGTIFDVKALQSSIFIDSLDIHVGFGSTIVEVYFAPRTYRGIENTPLFWNLGVPFFTDTVQGQGRGNATTVALDSSIFVPFGETYGIYIVTSTFNPQLVTGNGADLVSVTDVEELVELTSGVIVCDRPFNGFFNTGYQFNGTIHFRALKCSSPERKVNIDVPVLDLGDDFKFGCSFGGNTNNSEITLNADLKVPAIYEWSTGDSTATIEIKESGIYWASVTPLSCDTQVDTVAGDLISLTYDYTITPDTTTFEPKFNVELELLGDNTLGSVVWETTSPIQRDTIGRGLLPGDYGFIMRDVNGCFIRDTITVPPEFNNGVEGIIGNLDFLNIYPNPTDDILNVQLKLKTRGEGTFELFNSQGQKMLISTFKNFTALKEYPLELGGLSSGIYFLSILPEGEPKPIFVKVIKM